MALYESIKLLSGIAGEALTIYRFVSLQTDGKYDVSGAGERIDGICAESVAADGDCFPRVMPGGEAKVEAGAAVSIGDLVQSDASGRAITHVSGAGVGRGGKALTAAAAAGDIITIEFEPDLDQVT